MKHLYLITRGKLPSQDYKWVEVTKDPSNQLLINDESILGNELSTNSENRLVNSGKYSLAIARINKGLVLLVTGLRTKLHDYYDRPIRCELAWSGPDDSNTEKNIRGIASAFLRNPDEFESLMNQYVSFDDKTKTGFAISPDLINALEQYQTTEATLPANHDKRVGLNNKFTKSDLANELQKSAFPKNHKGIIYIVTESTTQDILEKSGVWFAITDSIAPPPPSLAPRPSKKKKPTLKFIFTMCMILLVTLAVFLIFLT